MTEHEMLKAIMDLQIQVAVLATKVNWLILGILVPAIGGLWSAVDNHKKQKAIIKFLNGGK